VRIRRPRYLAFFCDDYPFLDVDELLRGKVEPVTARQLCAFSILREAVVELSPEEFDLVLATPSDDWVEADDEDLATELARKGVLVAEDGNEELRRLREREERLADLTWNLESALSHFVTKWRGVDLREIAGQDGVADLLPPSDDAVRGFVDRFGPPPPALRESSTETTIELPRGTCEGAFYDVLLRRRTTRSFDRETLLPLAELATVLRFVFGYHGYARLFGEITTLKRTSPSAGGFHPVDAYALLIGVEGVEPGLYHYNGWSHRLELIEGLAADEARELATQFVCGQSYFADAHALFVLAARFDRAFWKYRNHQKALTALLMDAAHLSQTLYLVATELGLGAFVTAAVNNADIEERLGLDGAGEGVLAVCGCGLPAAEPSPFDPEFTPFTPGSA
jgi:putative peptide maturation dehydrogenase